MNAREKLVELLTEFYGSDPMYYGVDALAIAEHLIGNGVTVQECELEDKKTNAVKVVRCNDCIHSYGAYLYDGYCTYCGYLDCVVQPEFYCADGKRKENE